MDIRLYTPVDLEAVLELLERSDNTSRTPATWTGNGMTAALAFDGDRLVGAIPVEPRTLCLGGNRAVRALWVSGAHVDEEYRSRGIGTMLDRKLREAFADEYDAIFVYRADETSRAFRWYARLGFHVLLPVVAYKAKAVSTGAPEYRWREGVAGIEAGEVGLFSRLTRTGAAGGNPLRHANYWSTRIKSHCYGAFYKHGLLTVGSDEDPDSYAVLGETTIRDGVKRFDILDHGSPSDRAAWGSLIRAVMDLAAKRGLEEVRLQLSDEDRAVPWVGGLGFEKRWETNVMGSAIDPPGYLGRELRRAGITASIEIETPGLGACSVGDGEPALRLSMPDVDLTRLLFSRMDLVAGVEDGRAELRSGDRDVLATVAGCFPKERWEFHQLDYV
ncbi:GNAT family N-acetyltransferase [Verrucomicrobiota bacterium]